MTRRQSPSRGRRTNAVQPATTTTRQSRVHTFVPNVRPRGRSTKPYHSDPRYLHFWTLAVNDLALHDQFIAFAFVPTITDLLGKPLLTIGHGERPLGFMRYRYGRGYDIQIVNGLTRAQELLTTLHELRHVAQHVYKQWDGWEWNGVRISKRTPYRQLPWEKDAEWYSYQKIILIARAAGYDIDNEL